MMLDQQLLQAPVLDHDAVDLDAADRVTYLIEQSFQYDYAAPVEHIRQRLVVVPKARHGAQHLLAHRLEVHGARATRRTRRDTDGNTVVQIRADRVERSLRFSLGALVERVQPTGPLRLSAQTADDPRLLRATALTAADDRLRELAAELGGHGDSPIELAGRICAAVHAKMTYEYGVTSVQTTAAQALEFGRGVCQDSAHVMLALCHLLRLPARYVSGHLLGQGGTHAWVEVVVPAGLTAGGARDRLAADHCVALPFDPCNGTPASARYVTIATGRDYSDVAPASGSYVGRSDSSLSTTRRVAVLAAS